MLKFSFLKNFNKFPGLNFSSKNCISWKLLRIFTEFLCYIRWHVLCTTVLITPFWPLGTFSHVASQIVSIVACTVFQQKLFLQCYCYQRWTVCIMVVKNLCRANSRETCKRLSHWSIRWNCIVNLFILKCLLLSIWPLLFLIKISF